MSLADAVLGGDLRAAARLMRDLDDRQPGATEELRRLYPHTGRARIVGITGNPGCGKSTLVDVMIRSYRGRGLRVGVVAVDPSSPFSGGAILGDRIRMQRHALDEGVFIRSLATRGHLGGLSRSTDEVVAVLDAAGFDRVLIETVGVGQDEVDVVASAHRAVVVVVPGLGDEVQAMKAGILEVGDILCVNKADRPGADRAVQDLAQMLGLRSGEHPRPPILQTVAISGQGVGELCDELERQLGAASGAGPAHDWSLRRARRHLEELLREEGARRAIARLGARFDELCVEVAARRRDPYTLAEQILDGTL